MCVNVCTKNVYVIASYDVLVLYCTCRVLCVLYASASGKKNDLCFVCLNVEFVLLCPCNVAVKEWLYV